MFFKNLAIIATLAFSAISSTAAAPLSAESNSILARCDCESAAGIVSGVTASVGVYTSQLRGLAASDVTVEVLTPIIANIKAEISAGVGKLSVLSGQDAEIIMASVDGSTQISVSSLAQLVATLIIDVFGALGFVLNLTGVVSVTAVVALLVSVGEILGCFCCCLLSVTAGVAVNLALAIVPLISVDIIAIIGQLGCTMIAVALGINLTL